jgi:hypothetical protein
LITGVSPYRLRRASTSGRCFMINSRAYLAKRLRVSANAVQNAATV